MTYKIKQSSPLLWFFSFLTFLLVGMGTIIYLANNNVLPKEPKFLVFVIVASVVGGAFFLPRYTSTAEIEMTINEEGIKRKCIRRFLLGSQSDLEMKWTDIEDYIFQPDRKFDQFKLHLKNGKKIKFYHDNGHDNKDDFRKFLFDFSQRVEKLNNADKDKQNDIKIGKTIYETTGGLILAAFAILIIVGLPIFLIAIPTKHSPNYFGLGTAYIGAIYFLVQVSIHRKKRKEYEDSFK